MRLAWFYGMMILMMVEAGCESPAFVVKVNREMAPGTGFLQREKSYSVDRERVILSGISLGGYGAYCLAARYPEKFCAVVTMSGLSEERVAKKLTSLPVWCFHYATDPFVGCVNSERMVERIN